MRDLPIFRCFECNFYLYLRSAFIYHKSPQTVYVGVSMKLFNLFKLKFHLNLSSRCYCNQS